MRLLKRITALVVVVWLVLVMAACGGDEDTATPTTTPGTSAPASTTPATTQPATSVPATTAPATTTPVTTVPATTAPTTQPATTAPTTEPVDLVDVRVYFLRGERLVVEHRDVAGPAVLRGALTALLEGPTADETEAGIVTTVPAGTELRGVDLDDGLATVDLTAEFATGGGTLSMSARLAQVVFTATQFPNVDRVVFWLDGEPIDTLGGEGLVIDEPQTRASMTREITGAVIIDTPEPGATVTSPIRIVGEADVYEAQFPIEIWRDGEQIDGLAPVTGGAWGTWGTFDVTIDVDAAPGPIQIVTYDEGGCGDGPECPEPIRTVVDVTLA